MSITQPPIISQPMLLFGAAAKAEELVVTAVIFTQTKNNRYCQR
jgi:hypothetical protein